MKQVIVTTSWDDGHILDLKIAALLEKYRLAGTFYVSPENRELAPFVRLNDKQIRHISRKFEIGAHTMTHPRLTMVDEQTARKEIIESKQYLEKVTGKTVVSFCYPGGAYTPNHVVMVRQAGFRFARTTERFHMSIGSQPFETPTSLHAYQHWSDLAHIAAFSGYHPTRFVTNYLYWDRLAMAFFDRTLQMGGIFHLWGHSWEVDTHGDWQKLERVFKYISAKKGVSYVPNEKLI